MNKPVGLYVHVPFCIQKCIYCDFYSLPDADDKAEAYTSAVCRNIEAKKYRYDTVFFGGGTPTLLPYIYITDILSSADIDINAEITVEANPETVTEEELLELRRAGVNRISFGVQSLNDDALKMLGRIHSAETAIYAIQQAVSAGFDNISADLIIGLPKFGGKRQVGEDISRLIETGIKHISVYMLKVEQNTPLSRSRELCSLIDDDRTADEYLSAVEHLYQNGFGQYEISNFAKKGFECKHNLKYWHCEEYFGVGTSAHSFIDGKRFYTPADIDRFINDEIQTSVITDEDAGDREERLMLALRLSEGVALAEYPEIEAYSKHISAHGLCRIKNDRISLTANGFLVSNEIIAQMMELLDH